MGLIGEPRTLRLSQQENFELFGVPCLILMAKNCVFHGGWRTKYWAQNLLKLSAQSPTDALHECRAVNSSATTVMAGELNTFTFTVDDVNPASPSVYHTNISP